MRGDKMSISTSTNRMTAYTGNGVATSFSVTFPVRVNTDLVVYTITSGVVALKTLTTHYTVEGLDDNSGVSVDFLVAPAVGVSILILRIRPITQATDIKNQGAFYPKTYEDALDHIIMIAQQHQDDIDRSLHLAETVSPSAVSMEIPYGTPADFADALIKFNADGDGIEIVPLSDIAEVVATSSHSITDGQAAANLTGETFDGVVYSSVKYQLEISRGTTVFANVSAAAQYINSTWRIVVGESIAEEAHGVTLTVSQSTTVGQLRAALDAGAGNGTLKIKKIYFIV